MQVTIDDLIPGSRYKFRIKSENNYGISNPGDESDPFDVGGVTSDRSVKSCFIRICVLIFVGYKLGFDENANWDILFHLA